MDSKTDAVQYYETAVGTHLDCHEIRWIHWQVIEVAGRVVL